MKIIKELIYLFALLAPKFDKIVIIPYPDWEDMTLALYNSLIKAHNQKKIIWLIKNRNSIKYFNNITPNTFFIKRTSLHGIYHQITAKLIFCTHGTVFLKVPWGTTIINLWHGFGFKAVGTFLSGSNGHACSYTIGSSEFSRKFFAAQMNIKISKVIPLGFARNDRLLDAFSNKKRIIKKLKINHFKAIIIWMPTYRRSVEGDIRNDGIQFNNPFNLEYFDLKLFHNFLFSKNILCLFKSHPLALKFDLKQSNNFQIVTDDWLMERELSLYQLLGLTDLLISDVSSVITDYLAINKPIIHAMSDFNEYVATRPLLLNPPHNFLVGPLVINQNELNIAIERILETEDTFSSKREELKNLFFDANIDNKSTQRILNFLNI